MSPLAGPTFERFDLFFRHRTRRSALEASAVFEAALQVAIPDGEHPDDDYLQQFDRDPEND
jgi:hypothetical protein